MPTIKVEGLHKSYRKIRVVSLRSIVNDAIGAHLIIADGYMAVINGVIK